MPTYPNTNGSVSIHITLPTGLLTEEKSLQFGALAPWSACAMSRWPFDTLSTQASDGILSGIPYSPKLGCSDSHLAEGFNEQGPTAN